MGALARSVETASDRAAFMRESLHRVQDIAGGIVAILGSFDHRLSALDTAVRPTQVKTHSIMRAHQNIDKTLKVAEVILGQFDLARQAEAEILKGPHDDLESYLKAVDQLKCIINFFSGNKDLKSGIGVVNQANSLLEKAVVKLEEEFQQLLTRYSKPVEPDRLFDCLPSSMRPSAGSPCSKNLNTKKPPEHLNKSLETHVCQLPTLIPPRIVPLLCKIAQQMIQAGRQNQVLICYREPRCSAIERTLRKLDVENIGNEDVQKMQWEVLEAKIGNWTNMMRIAFKVLFAGEKKVCDQIFLDNDNLRDQCFAEATTHSVEMLLSFGDAIAKSKKQPEKLFVLLDMYETMQELQSEMDTTFRSKLCSEMRENFMTITKRLAQTAQETFCDFEVAVRKDNSKTAVLDGTVHPLTTYVVNYVKFLFEYRSTLLQLFEESSDTNAEEHLTTLTTGIIQALHNNLDGKSKQYTDPALTHLFLMNNIHYVVRCVHRSDVKDQLGSDWVQIHRRVVQQHANQYKRIAWAKILQCLTIQGSQLGLDALGSTGISRAQIKERFRTFNIQFEEIHHKQSRWTVPDSELRESLRLAVAEVVLPAYRSFILRFGPVVEGGRNPSKYIKYSPEDIERLLGDFFTYYDGSSCELVQQL